jgi:hypothetical protein
VAKLNGCDGRNDFFGAFWYLRSSAQDGDYSFPVLNGFRRRELQRVGDENVRKRTAAIGILDFFDLNSL